MACFGIGASFLKASPLYAPVLKVEHLMLDWWHLILAVFLVVLALVGNLIAQQGSLISFVAYISATYAVCLVCLYARPMKKKVDSLWLSMKKRRRRNSSTTTEEEEMEEEKKKAQKAPLPDFNSMHSTVALSSLDSESKVEL